MRKRNCNKLTLSRDTLRHLDGAILAEAVGATAVVCTLSCATNCAVSICVCHTIHPRC
ncbi:MAG: hypothetical protein JOZ15_17925 [Acidobacteria bacterium]|nr:hypothetical protein [Acidobacteriota bacterium]